MEEVKEYLSVSLKNEDVFMAPVFSEFCAQLVRRFRGESNQAKLEYFAIKVESNNLTLNFPNQLFINNNFVDSEGGQALDCINPCDESIICQVSYF